MGECLNDLAARLANQSRSSVEAVRSVDGKACTRHKERSAGVCALPFTELHDNADALSVGDR